MTCFWIWAENVWQDGQTAFTCPVEQCWKVESLGQNQSFLSFPQNMWNSFATSNENGRVVKLAFIISSGTFWGKNRLNETVSRISPCFDFQQKILGRVVTPLPRFRRECSERKHNFELYSIFFNSAEWFLVELRTAIYVSRRTFSATSFGKSVFCFDSRTLSKNLVRLFTKSFRQFFQNWHPFVQKNKLRRQVFYGKCRLFLSVPDFER